MVTDALYTRAWLLVGLFVSVPGVLKLADGHLVFTTEEGRIFDTPLSKVSEVKFPWYYFGGGVKFRIESDSYRLSFVRPNDASDIPGRILARTEGGGPAALLTATRKFSDIGEGRRVGKAWKTVLAARTSSQKA